MSALLTRAGGVGVALALALAGASCSSGETGEADRGPEAPQILSPERVEGGDGEEPPGVQLVEDSERLEGRVLNDPSGLSVGECFNEYIVYFNEPTPQELTTVVDCAAPHFAEVYHSATHPAEEGFPGVDALRAWSEQQCYGQFEGFVGAEYEVSKLEIGFRAPAADDWNDPRVARRDVMCYVYAQRGEKVLGTVRGSGF